MTTQMAMTSGLCIPRLRMMPYLGIWRHSMLAIMLQWKQVTSVKATISKEELLMELNGISAFHQVFYYFNFDFNYHT